MNFRALLFLWFLSTFAFSAAARAQCTVRYDLASLASQIAVAKSFVTKGGEAFSRQAVRVGEMVHCLEEPLTPSMAAEVHRVVGMQAVLSNDFEYGELAFRVSRALDPDYTFAEMGLSSDHPAHSLYASVSHDPVETVTLPRATQGLLFINGRPVPERPKSGPAVIQWVAPDGSVNRTAYLWPGMPVFDYPTDPAAAAQAQAAAGASSSSQDSGKSGSKGSEPAEATTGPTADSKPDEPPPSEQPSTSDEPASDEPTSDEPGSDEPASAAPPSGVATTAPKLAPEQNALEHYTNRGPDSRWTRPLAVTAGVSTVVAGLCYASALRTAAEYRRDAPTGEEAESLLNQNHSFYYAAVAAGGLAVGSGVGAVITLVW